MYGLTTERIDLKNITERQSVESFLSTFNLLLDEDVEATFVLRDIDIIGTCSVAGNVLKCFAVKSDFQGQGISSMLISSAIDYLFEKGVYEYFIYCMSEKKQYFMGFGLKEVYSIKGVTLLEGGTANVRKYVDEMFKKSGLDKGEKAALVMNCNPFTLGHRYLIEKASIENKEVVVFIVEENKSEYSFKDRIELVKKGTEDLKNVKIIPGGQYIISSATFPTYFLKEKNDKLKLYTAMDAGMFGEYIAPIFNIKARYVGTEPFCEVTDSYNAALLEVLPKYNIELKLVERLEVMNEAVSASRVRKLLKEKDWEQIKLLVPKTTLDYLYKRE